MSRVIPAPRPVNNTSLRVSATLPIGRLRTSCTKGIISLLNTPFNDRLTSVGMRDIQSFFDCWISLIQAPLTSPFSRSLDALKFC